MPQEVTRTVCIGLGGTGRDILMRLRRLIIDRYGKLENFPIISFLHIDTDVQGGYVTGLKTGDRYRGEDIGFRSHEQVFVSISQDDIARFIRNAQNRDPRRMGPYDHILRWFDPQLLQNARSIEQGASGIRAIGRLAFFWNYSRIMSAVESAKVYTRGHDALLLQQQDLRVSPGESNIFVTGSLCGGTGSGMFLDVAYSLKQNYEGNTVTGYFVISPELYREGQSTRMQASTYAALMELDHFSQKETSFQSFYDLSDRTSFLETTNPPFNFLYLVGNSTTGLQYQVGSKDTLCNVIAQVIALDFYSEVGVRSQSNLNNVQGFLIREDNHPCGSTQRYLSFGLASIYYPHDRIYSIAIKKVAQKLIHFWINGLPKNVDPQSLPQKLLNDFKLQSWNDNLIETLKGSVIENNKSISNLLGNWQTQQINLANNCKTKDDRRERLMQTRSNFEAQFIKSVPSVHQSSRGIWLKALETNNQNLITKYKQDIDQFLKDLLHPSASDFSLKNARNWLESIIQYCELLKLEIAEKQTREHDLHGLIQQYETLKNELEDLEKKLFGKKSQFREKYESFISIVVRRINENIESFLVSQTLLTLKHIRDHAQQHFDRVNNYINELGTVDSYLDTDIKSLRGLEFSMTGEAIFEENDISLIFENLLPPNDHQELCRLSTRLLDRFYPSNPRIDSFYQWIQQNDRPDYKLIFEDFHAYLPQEVSHQGQQSMEPVINRFLRKYSQNSSTRLEQIIQSSKPLLPFTSDEFFKSSLDQEFCFVGFKDDNSPEVQRFKDYLKQVGIQNTDLIPTQRSDEILIMHQYAAFPLRIIHNLSRWEAHYQQEIMSENRKGMHTDNQVKFELLIPPELQRLEQLEQAFFPCLALGYLESQEWQTFLNDRPWKSIFRHLNRDHEQRNHLFETYQSLKQEIYQDYQLWYSSYKNQLDTFEEQIRNLPNSNKNYAYQKRLLDQYQQNILMVQQGIISHFRTDIEDYLSNFDRPSPPVIEGGNDTIEVDSSIIHSSVSNRDRRREELIQLQEDLKRGIITQEEYELEKEKIYRQYPIN